MATKFSLHVTVGISDATPVPIFSSPWSFPSGNTLCIASVLTHVKLISLFFDWAGAFGCITKKLTNNRIKAGAWRFRSFIQCFLRRTFKVFVAVFYPCTLFVKMRSLFHSSKSWRTSLLGSFFDPSLRFLVSPRGVSFRRGVG